MPIICEEVASYENDIIINSFDKFAALFGEIFSEVVSHMFDFSRMKKAQ